MKDYEITIELTDEQTVLIIDDVPEEGHDDFFILAWVLVKLLKAFVISHPDRIAQLRKILDMTLKMDKELIN